MSNSPSPTLPQRLALALFSSCIMAISAGFSAWLIAEFALKHFGMGLHPLPFITRYVITGFIAEFPLWFVGDAMPPFWEAEAFARFVERNSTLYLTRTMMDLIIFGLLLVFFGGFRHLIVLARASEEWLATTFFGVAIVAALATRALVASTISGAASSVVRWAVVHRGASLPVPYSITGLIRIGAAARRATGRSTRSGCW